MKKVILLVLLALIVASCNKIENAKSHSIENVEPCSKECNDSLVNESGSKNANYLRQVYQYTLDGELVKKWKSIEEAEKNGFYGDNIFACCVGIINTHRGYIWSYTPLSK